MTNDASIGRYPSQHAAQHSSSNKQIARRENRHADLLRVQAAFSAAVAVSAHHTPQSTFAQSRPVDKIRRLLWCASDDSRDKAGTPNFRARCSITLPRPPVRSAGDRLTERKTAAYA